MKKPVKRSTFTAQITEANLPMDQFFISAIRPIGPDDKGKPQIQLEVGQKRNVNGRISVLGMLNRSDNRFRQNGTLLLNWMKTYPEDVHHVFPDMPLTLDELESIAKSWKEDAPVGPDSMVVPVLKPTNILKDQGKTYEPIIVVTEVTESDIASGKFFTKRSARYEENIANALEKGYRSMRTGSDEEAENIVDANTGDRIFRYTRVEVVGTPTANDVLIPNKVTESIFKETGGSTAATTTADSFEELSEKIVGADTI